MIEPKKIKLLAEKTDEKPMNTETPIHAPEPLKVEKKRTASHVVESQISITISPAG